MCRCSILLPLQAVSNAKRTISEVTDKSTISIWDPAQEAANRMARGIPHTVVTSYPQKYYAVLMLDDENRIIGV